MQRAIFRLLSMRSLDCKNEKVNKTNNNNNNNNNNKVKGKAVPLYRPEVAQSVPGS
jgi:hypothetical protein